MIIVILVASTILYAVLHEAGHYLALRHYGYEPKFKVYFLGAGWLMHRKLRLDNLLAKYRENYWIALGGNLGIVGFLPFLLLERGYIFFIVLAVCQLYYCYREYRKARASFFRTLGWAE